MAPTRAVGHGLAWIAAENLDVAFLWSDQTEQRRDCGRLAGPVWSEERDDLALGHRQVQPVEGNPEPVAVGDSPGRKGRLDLVATRASGRGSAARREDKTFSGGSGRARDMRD